MSTTASCTIDVTYGDPSPAGLPVSLGVPFPAGALKDVTKLTVQSPSGERRPAGARVLAKHRDGSIRWCLVSFGAREAGRHQVCWDKAVAVAAPTVSVQQTGSEWKIDGGRLKVTVCESGPGMLKDIVCDGHAYLTKPEDLRFCVDDATTQCESKRTVRVIEATPLRVKLRVEGAHFRPNGTRCLNYRLDVEVWAGWPTLRLDYHYFNLEPKQPAQHIKRIAIESAWNLGPKTQRHFLQQAYGLFYISRHVYNPAPVALAADFTRSVAHVEDPAMLLDDVDYPFYLNPPLVNTHDWLGVGDEKHFVYVRMEDLTAARPNRITSAGNTLNVEAWPSTADTLELPQGRSRRQTFTFSFIKGEEAAKGTAKNSAAPVQAPKGIAALLTAPIHEPRATVTPAWVAHCGEFKQNVMLPAGKHSRMEANLGGLVRLDMPFTKFDVGDTDSHYAGIYSLTAEELVPALAGAPRLPRIFPKSYPTQTYMDCHEPVWTNNEYDAIHVFCSEILRTGRSDLWNTLRLAARHNIEVDFLHYSDHKWIHRSTPAHSARHTTTGSYPSHFWTQGLLEYYCMTGDIDALEVAYGLGDKTIENFTDPEVRPILWGFNREIGWSVLTLTCLVDITGETRFKSLLDEMVNYLIAFDRGSFRGGVHLSGGNDRMNLNAQIICNFFGYSSMVEGVDLYVDMTRRKDVAEWLSNFMQDLADEQLKMARAGGMLGLDFSTALVVGYERTGDKRFIDQMSLLLDTHFWNKPGVDGGATAKLVAMLYRGFPRMLGHALKHGLLDQYEYPSLRALAKADDAKVKTAAPKKKKAGTTKSKA